MAQKRPQETIPGTVVDLGVLEGSSSHIPLLSGLQALRLVGLYPMVLSPLSCALEQAT